jgi:hypothetical protein
MTSMARIKGAKRPKQFAMEITGDSGRGRKIVELYNPSNHFPEELFLLAPRFCTMLSGRTSFAF